MLIHFESDQSVLEINIYKNYLMIRNNQLNQVDKIAFYDSNQTWHSIELINADKLTIKYSVAQLHLTQTKTVNIINADQLVFGKRNEYLNAACLRDVSIDNQLVFMSNLNDVGIKYGCDPIQNECGSNYCQHGANCVYKWFSNECLNCNLPFYGEQCQFGKYLINYSANCFISCFFFTFF